MPRQYQRKTEVEAMTTTRTPCSYPMERDGLQRGDCGKPFWGFYGGYSRCREHMPVGQCQAMTKKAFGYQCDEKAESVSDDFCATHTAKAQATPVFCRRCNALTDPAHHRT